MFTTVLIANRGEIALRIARTCRELGLRVVAVYSTEDRDSAVVQAADDAVCIGPGPARSSYLDIAAILEAARRTGADAVHPGYGFLSEVGDFAEACEAYGITFVGPPGPVIDRLGDKAVARSTMAAAGLPVLPGSSGPVTCPDGAARLAAEIGYPVMVKAVAGGGGRGMVAITDPEKFIAQLREARCTAQSLFGDDRLYLERFLPAARHVEVQVLCDQYGNAVHLGQRDCSAQRRRQKIIEETPAPLLPEATRQAMGEAALRGALAAGYVGAGTFEFLVDPDGGYHFMEINCRIQVEHPVTELTHGVDIVRQQLLVAAGERLELTQDTLVPRGAAIECRINAEDPARGFVPAPGRIEKLRLPGGPFVRVDTDAYAGGRISPAYDPLLAKLCVWAPDRPQALARMRRALAEFQAEGPGLATNRDFLLTVLDHPRFIAGTHDTSLVGELTAEPVAV
ncbi:acetyl-CoA carboxylase biotin carboxylase subunit [Catellatospora sp. TT07R-123]|uniref:acetyl-CoA carboxylase biotin carboxylase subunit n=1 Tax=Catellatospora sp. TT07R-123 TaxID=2733863 RepID=UPI001B13DEBA|nr:biotin carboxylase N-terminal domain-containing protein [Catellatospora sp. TT07R-123]GHJ45227.1 acetyl-CoA carboxylase biotin carboxylase subunit [Catellatospora sp. TT07R-123]